MMIFMRDICLWLFVWYYFCLILVLKLNWPYKMTHPLCFLEETVKNLCWASLVAQWLRVCLLMQGTRVRALVWEDPTCHGAAGPVSHNC